ncbi:MAG TPA: hypothetical protein PKM73_10220 [Verrucomicrobiota bacterium]|nr:hypothetical protein [Verrucomicrobiota bacterium]HNU50100.1 hypothetical protein [Verrucomicrobiota bacterium]
MSTSKLDGSTPFRAFSGSDSRTAFKLQADQVAFRHNGIEFLSPNPIPLWTEVNVDLRSPLEPQPVRGSGVVVDCAGNRHTGYVVSLVFMGLTRQSQARLSQLARPRPA